tara:strand:+ start:1676 stop:1996 length:321 start_codon:yes stop_codon:yes gene_type:complete
MKKINDETFLLLKIKIKYLCSKTDKFENENSYFEIENNDFDMIIKDFPEHLKMPYFITEEKKYILKIKSKYLIDELKINGESTITLKKYNYQDLYKGIYITKIVFG